MSSTRNKAFLTLMSYCGLCKWSEHESEHAQRIMSLCRPYHDIARRYCAAFVFKRPSSRVGPPHSPSPWANWSLMLGRPAPWHNHRREDLALGRAILSDFTHNLEATCSQRFCCADAAALLCCIHATWLLPASTPALDGLELDGLVLDGNQLLVIHRRAARPVATVARAALSSGAGSSACTSGAYMMRCASTSDCTSASRMLRTTSAARDHCPAFSLASISICAQSGG